MAPIDQLIVRARSRCNSCQAPIVWADTGNGKRMPVNPQPSSVGNVVLFVGYDADGTPRLSCNTLRHTQLSGARASGQTLRTAHFRDCPDANRHRKRTNR